MDTFETSQQRPAWIEVDLGAIANNIRALRSLISDTSEIMAVVKANAYGHGVIPVAQAALRAGATSLGVALPQELTELRAAGIDASCLVMMEPGSGQDADVWRGVEACIEGDGAFAVSSRAVAEAADARALALGRRARVHLKVDTGMHRMGVLPKDALDTLRFLSGLQSVEVEGIFTHFACADEHDRSTTEKQIERFNTVLAVAEANGLRPEVAHAANSAGAILYPEAHYGLVRVGIAMYGLEPGEATVGKADLRPALSLRAKVARTHVVPSGEGVSYGHEFVASAPVAVGALPLGYADGYRRGLSGRATVLAHGRRLPQRGRVCMDQFMFEYPSEMGINPGDTVTLIGEDGEEFVSADDLASILGTINYEIVTGLSLRLPRVYKDELPGNPV